MLNQLQMSWSAIKLGRVLGQGGFGVVYQAKWQVGGVDCIRLCMLLSVPLANWHAEDGIAWHATCLHAMACHVLHGLL